MMFLPYLVAGRMIYRSQNIPGGQSRKSVVT
ncbi:MAG: hypothetical protein ACI9MJ_001169 [Alphaproteobacteria bacterium]|jgi:hypothetical protein